MDSLFPRSGLIPFDVICLVVAIVSMVLRFWASFVSSGLKLNLDDWLAIGSLIITPAIETLCIFMVNLGVGLNINTEVSEPEQSIILKYMYVAKLLWDIDTSLVRFSALAFYGRIFRVRSSTNKTWKLCFYAVCLICALWLLVLLIFDAFIQCKPIQAFWEGPMESCVSLSTIYLLGTAGNFATDILVLLLPLPQVLKFNITWHRKLAISVSFILGYSVAFMSLGRLITTLPSSPHGNPSNWTYSLGAQFYWDAAEISFGILAICLPAILQLEGRRRRLGWRLLFRPKQARTSYYAAITSKSSGSERTQEIQQLWQPGWDNLYDGPTAFGNSVTVSAGSPLPERLIGRKHSAERPGLSPQLSDGIINVTQNIEIKETRLV